MAGDETRAARRRRLTMDGECPATGGSCRVGQPPVLMGMRLKSVAQFWAERSIVDRAANLKQEIGASSGPPHLQ